MTTAVAPDGGDVLVEGLGLPLVGQVDVDVAVLGFKLGLKKTQIHQNYCILLKQSYQNTVGP